jgi:hypothetical protein
MSGNEMKNVVASVLARLRNNSKSSGAPFQQVLQLYAIERFLYRISKSTHAQSVILKVLRSLARREKLTKQWKAGSGWVAS